MQSSINILTFGIRDYSTVMKIMKMKNEKKTVINN